MRLAAFTRCELPWTHFIRCQNDQHFEGALPKKTPHAAQAPAEGTAGAAAGAAARAAAGAAEEAATATGFSAKS